jgi:hypothetical protein
MLLLPLPLSLSPVAENCAWSCRRRARLTIRRMIQNEN